MRDPNGRVGKFLLYVCTNLSSIYPYQAPASTAAKRPSKTTEMMKIGSSSNLAAWSRRLEEEEEGSKGDLGSGTHEGMYDSSFEL
jgi:hypothetical protein